MNCRQIVVDQSAAVEFTKDRHDAASAMHIFHMDVRLGRRHLAQHRHAPRQAVDVVHGEIDLGLVCCGQNMQDGIRRAAHGDVERHGVFEGPEARHIARQHALVVLLVVAPRDIDNQMAGLDEQPLAVGVSGKGRPVARQRQAERLGQAIHRVRRKHARARSAGGTSRALDNLHVLVRDTVIGGSHHGIDKVQRLADTIQHNLARLHRPARDEHRRNVEPERGHQHAGRDLVAIGNAHHGIGAVAVDHVFDRVSNDLARWQAVEHAVMAHGDAVIDGDGVELLGDAAGFLDLAGHQLPQILEMHMTRHELREGVDHRDDRLAEILILDTGGPPQPAGARHVAAVSSGA